ncbi:putative Synaptophysin [Hypsibius exemplaris]|uniref:Synaptophysin n=1 Tax=Hypsibius exemplaris TaxID=2072580 RepID=A0A1W0X9P8_HYPEX|nr:putative Synaptophysin [Hypsibius exemplaris]
MDAIRTGMEFNGRVWKEPRGFIKILELIFGICAFGTTSSFSSAVKVLYNCVVSGKTEEKTVVYDFEYPFNLEKEPVSVNACNSSSATIVLGGSYASSAEFFVAVGVLTFLYCLAALLLYIFLDKLYRSRDSVSTGDFIITVVVAFLWLVASSAWAHGVSGVKSATNGVDLVSRLNEYKSDTGAACASCLPAGEPNYANLNISVLFGFLNFFIWSGNVWFLYKETAWYKNAHPELQQPPPPMTGSVPGMAPAKI